MFIEVPLSSNVDNVIRIIYEKFYNLEKHLRGTQKRLKRRKDSIFIRLKMSKKKKVTYSLACFLCFLKAPRSLCF